ncbi:MAG: dicarboxylate/amino acid:cation symporter, partial [Planctomycetes bacterium]|nr:dicarboxylate/amino acid:cation symporter [Planctomycetota bacterium]
MKLKLHYQILIGMVLGAGIGLPLNILAGMGHISVDWPRTVATYGKGAGDVFLRLLSMIVAPLILTSLVSGITGTGNLRGLGRMGARTMTYYLSTSMVAIITGILVFNVIQPGRNSNLADLMAGAETVTMEIADPDQSVAQTLWNQVFNLIPSNPFAALADASNRSILGVIFFAILFGVFITVVGGEVGQRLTHLFKDAFDVMMRMTMFIIKLAPVGVFGFMLFASAGKGLSVFAALGWYALTVAIGLSIHAFITLPLILILLGRRSPRKFFQAMSPALLTAFSTASSNGTLPLTITCVEKRAGISNRISSFVLPLGATINMDGTALYEAVAVLFIAQVTGHELGFAAQAIVAFTALLASIGAAGIPHAGTVMMIVVLRAVNLPVDYVGLILAVDRVLDMYRTSINVWSDSTACAVLARFES